MKIGKKICILMLILSSSSLFAESKVSGQFTPGNIWLDNQGEPINAHGGQVIKQGNTYYWIGENRVTTRKNTGKVNIYSSKDLYHWDSRGVALDLSSMPEKFAIERPKIIYNDKNKMYYMWFHLELHGSYNTSMVGIAESTSLDKPFKYINKFWPNPGMEPINTQFAKSGHDLAINTLDADNKFQTNMIRGSMFRDMTIFKDEDGKGYVVFESDGNKSIHIAEMNSNFDGLTGRYVRLFVGAMNEAPTIFKHSGKYFLITSGVNGFAPSQARLAVSDNILGNWNYVGTPVKSDNKQDLKTTYNSQGTFVYQIPGTEKYIFMADRWDPKNLDNSTYVWLPIVFENNTPEILWKDQWSY